MKLLFLLNTFVKVPPVPVTINQEPFPFDGLFASRVTCVNPQVEAPVISAPAFATDGAAVVANVATELYAAAQLPLVTTAR